METVERAARTMQRLSQLAEIGRDGRAGAHRPGLSAAEQKACELVATWLRQEDMAVSWDACGNLYGRLAGTDPAAGEIWSGSHLDTVPNGGRFDGALGVLAALEAVAQLREVPRATTLCVAVFRDEEGWRFGEGCFGSRCLCGTVTDADLRATDADGVTIGEALAALGYREPLGGGRLPAAFVEVHIEQGPVLERRGLAHAVVTSIAGMSGFTATITGSPGHAGTTPMEGRRDALLAAAELALALRERATRTDGAVVTVGRLTIADAASNVIPGRVTISIDARCPTAAGLEQLIDGVGDACSQVAAASGCAVALDPAWRSPPVPMSARVGDAMRQAAAEAGLELADLASGGGHDAGILAEAGVESGMLFVRSRNGGVSHRPEELTDEADVATAIQLLAGTLATLGGAG
jgi:allantoate deiminase